MNNKKQRNTFTLAEVLITLVIIGVIAILVVPGMIKDVNNKSRMALLQSVVTSINSEISNELTRSRTTTIESTAIVTNPQNFLSNLETINGDAFASSYINYNGASVEVPIPNSATTGQGAVHLKNGASVGIINGYDNRNSSAVVIDVNGKDEPNIVGVDYYILELAWRDDFTKGIHAGDLGGYETNSTDEELKAACLEGDGRACYKLAEILSFEPNYLTD